MRSSKKPNAKQLTSTLMAIVMTATTTFQMPTITMASEESTVAVESQIEEETTPASSEALEETSDSKSDSTVTPTTESFETTAAETIAEVTYEEESTSLSSEVDPSGTNTEESSANETRGPDETTEETTEVETEVSTEVETEESTKEDPFTSLDPTSGLSEEELAKIDFSSKRLLLAADASVIIDPEHVLSSYAGVYLMQYDTETQSKYAYAYYYNKSEFVDVDTVISVADGDNSANAAEPMAAEENPIAELQAAVSENPVHASGAVAVIDTGVNDVANVTESVSMIGDHTTDENGHGTKMANLIVEQNPDVSILSIKALGADGTGDVSAVYAAIRYAIDKKVSVINLSMSAVSTAENAALTSIIDEATEAGIAVVGAAGNKGMDVRFFVPGNIESAYIIGAADEDGKRVETSNYGDTVDFNVVADSTSEAAAKFSGYYTLNGAVADEKLVFPTDYVKEDEIDFNGPEVRHQISYYDYKGSMTDLVWIGMRQAKTSLDENEEYFTTYIGYVEDAEKVKDLDVCVDFMDTYREHKITDECIVDLENMQVKIPVSYQDSAITVRWYMTNASYGYAYDVDANYMMADTPEPFKAANNSNNSLAGLNFQKAQWFQQGTFSTGFTHTPDSMNHCTGSFSANDFKSGNKFTINSGYLAIVDESNNDAATIRGIFGPSSLRWYYRPEGSNELVPQDVNIQTFLTHFSNVTRAAGENDDETGNVTVGQDVSYLFNSVGGKGDGTIKVDTTGNGHWDSKISGSIGWVFGTCAYDYLNGQVPSFEAGGQIICTNIGSDGTAYFFYYCRSPKAQWAGGSFSITPEKVGYLKIHKSSSNPEMTDGNSCYSFDDIKYGVFTDDACVHNIAILNLDENGYSDALKLTPGTYYVREANPTPGSGYLTNSTVYTVTVTEGSTADAPIMCETQDAPLNDPLGIVIQKTSADGTTADLSGAIYTITYYPKQYSSVAEIAAETDSSIVPTVWKIQTLKNSAGVYTARLDDDHIVSGSAKDVFGKYDAAGTYKIPLGTITIEETSAPAGFTTEGATVTSAVDNTVITGENGVYLFNFVDEKALAYLKYGNSISNVIDQENPNESAVTLTYAEQRSYAGISLYKYDNDPDNPPVSRVHLNDIQFAIINANSWPVVNYAGNEIPQWGVVEVIRTDVNGYAATGKYDLPVGEYVVQELRSDATFDGATFTDGTSDYANYHYLWDGHQVNVTLTSDQEGTLVSVGPFYDQLANGGIELYKRDKSTEDGSASGQAELAGIRFAIINANTWKVINYAGEEIDPWGVVQVITTDENGHAATGTRDIPVGDYIVQEIRLNATFDGKTFYEGTSPYANDFYLWDGNNKASVSITKDQVSTLVSAGTFYDQVAAGGISIQKYDKTTWGEPDTQAELAGISFAIINKNPWKVKNKDGYLLDTDNVIQVITTDETGFATTGNVDIPLGHYLVKEIRYGSTYKNGVFTSSNSDYSNYFYLYDDNNQVYVDINANQVETIVSAGTFYDQVAVGGIQLYKYDSTTQKEAVKGASLAGVQFGIFNANNWKVKNKDGQWIDPWGCIQVIKTDENGYAATGKNDIPSGDYVVRELRKDATYDGTTGVFDEGTSDYANDSYFWADERDSVTISKDSAESYVWAKTFFDAPIYGPRGDFTFEKKNGETGEALSGIPFQVTNTTTGETHYIVTDTDGRFDSSKSKTTNTNANDATLSQYGDGDVIPESVIHSLTADAGLWFGTNSDGSSVLANDSYGALPFGTYTITELQTEATVSMNMYTGSFTIGSFDSVLDLGTINNSSMKIQTTLADVNGSHTVEATKSVTLIDHVAYTNLDTRTEYTLTGTLYVKDGSNLTALMTQTVSFTPAEAKGTVDVTFTFDASSLAGKSVVAFEELSVDGKFAADHKDRNDENQTVSFPDIPTRGEFTFEKKNGETGETLSGIPFQVTNTTTGETHYVVTNAKGIFHSAANKKSVHTNANDATLSQYGDNDVIPQTVIVSLVKDAGLWFEKEGEKTVSANDSYGSLPFGTYTITELKTEATKSMNMYTGTFTVDNSDTVLDLGTIENFSIGIGTTLADTTGSHTVEAAKSLTLIDHVAYTNLDTNTEYTLTGTLYGKDGESITAVTTQTVSFTPKKASGTQDVTFTFDASSLAGKSVVAFEELSVNGEVVAEHKDANDENQTVYFPSIKTKALDQTTKTNQIESSKKATLIDTVTYTNLLPGKEYTVSGKLMDKATGKELLINGKEITASKTFTAEKANGTVDVVFEFDSSAVASKTIVVFESLTYKDIEIATHTEITDKDQTVYVPNIKTTLLDLETESHNSIADSDITLVDTVSYEGLEVGRSYTVTGTLVDQETGKALLDDSGKDITASKEFTAEKSSGTVEVTFQFSGVSLAGKTTVAFEHLYTEGKEVAVHADLKDEGQTVYFPGIHTTAISEDTKDHVTKANEKVTITDQVALTALNPGTEYTVNGTLMDAATGKEILVNGKTITAEKTFTADAHEMTITLTYTLDASALAGTTTVVFENLYADGVLLAAHHDTKDAEQTVYLPKIRTKAEDATTKINQTEAKKKATIIDTVSYSSLLPGKEYTVTGTLRNKKTGKTIEQDGKPITASTTFTAEKSTGSVQITFQFDASILEGTTVVAFETMTYKGIEVAVHADIEDHDQTVYIPKIRTTAIGADTKDHVTEAKKDLTIVDTVSYEGLEVGREYTVTGKLMDQATKKAITVNGKEVTASTTFTAKTEKGSVDVTFQFDGSSLEDTQLVVFETLSTEKKEVAIHANINDASQTVSLPKIRTKAEDATTKINQTEAKTYATIIDTVSYSGLLVGKEYTVTGTLRNKKTGKAIEQDGKPITASTTFTAEKSAGTVQVVFKFDASVLEGTTVVAFETMTYKGIEVAVHADIEDHDQTVYIPKIRTTAIGADTKDHVTEAKKDLTIVDTVSYEGLEVGREYTVTGKLMDQATQKAITVNGKEVTASTTFTAKTEKGSVDVTFQFDGSSLEDTQLVVFETLSTEKKEVAIHADIKDEAQTVSIPKIRTKAEDATTKINQTEAKTYATIIDTVSYSGLLVGKEYTVTGTLRNKKTGKAIEQDGKPITASTTFTAEKSAGTVQVVFKFDASVLEGTTVVAFESMTYKGVEVAIHADITDKDQTVYLPKVRTTAISEDTKDHVTKANETITLIDTVSYESLEVGREYTVSGKLMDRASNKPILVDGKEVTAETTFTPTTTDGTVDVTFTFNGTGLEDTVIVVFETLYTEKKEVAVHADIKDEAQSVYVPEIRTKAEDTTTKINQTEAKKKATIIDTVSYSSLLPGKEYTVSGTLMNKKTGKAIEQDGKPITASTTFTAEKSSGSVPITFQFDASILEGTTVVAFETMTYKGIEVAVHADITDHDQTVYIPKVRTTAIGADTKDHVTEAKKDLTIVDTVSFEGLEVGREYTVKGILMDKATEKAVEGNGEEVTAETTFTAETTDGTVDVTFVFDGSALEDTLLVAFETLYTEEKEVGVHADIEDEAQTVFLPKIRTHAKDGVTDMDHTEALEKATIIDTVSYSSLLPGKEYTVSGTLMNKETGEKVLINGEPITASTTFTAEAAEGSVDIVFEFDASAIAGTTIVAFEKVEYKGVEVGVHADLTDEDQTVYIPDVHTTATAADTKDHVTGANEEVTITDEVALTGLKVGAEYTVKGVLMDQTTGKELLVDEKQIVSEETFTADQADMTITLTYTLDASMLAGTTTVVFETLYTEGKEVGRHHEIEDEGQTVWIPEIHTTAADQKTGMNHTKSEEQATIVDTVLYSHLLPGKEYTVKGTLMNKETGEAILINGEEVTAETTFTPEKAEGSVDVIFTFDASAIAGTTVVAFETLEYQGIEIGVHADIEDNNQTVYVPEIKTTAIGEDTKDHIEKAKKEAVIVDTVSYKGLEIGREYVMTGKLVDKETGEVLVDEEGNEITTSETFTPEEKDGSIEITFTFDASALAGKSLVAFETLTTEEKEVAIHADLTDEGQTVRIPKIHTTATDPVTGDHDGVVAKETTVLDEVFYENLIPGKEYTVTGTLMVKETGKALVVDGKEVKAEKTFTVEEANGSIVLTFTFDSSALAGTHLVAFEDMEYEGISIGSHEDLEDEDQTISYPEIHTSAADQTGSKTMTLGTNVTLVDTVSYQGLTKGKTYEVKGTIMDKASGKPIGITAEATFTAEEADGSTTVVFTFDTGSLQGKTLVVFESLYDTKGNLIVEHSDFNDTDQTVTVPEKPQTPPNPPVVTGDDSTPMPYVLALLSALLAAAVVVVVLVKRRKKQA